MTYPQQQAYPAQPHPQQYAQAQYPPPVPVHPHRMVTKRPLGLIETTFHAVMTLCTAGLWGIVWWSRVRSHRSVTTWQ